MDRVVSNPDEYGTLIFRLNHLRSFPYYTSLKKRVLIKRTLEGGQ